MSSANPTTQVKNVPVDLIRPGATQARRTFNQDRLQELADSIKESGVVQPVVLRSTIWGYELLAGERRWRATQLAGLHDIPALVRDDLTESEALVLGLIENLQRESLSPMETAAGLRRLGEVFELTHEQIADRVGKSRAYVSNYFRLLNLIPSVQTLVDEGHLTLGHAKVLAGVPSVEQTYWAGEVLSKKLSVHAFERKVSAARKTKVTFKPAKASDWRALEQSLSELMGYPVTVDADKSGKGEVKIKYHSLDELDGVLDKLGYKP